MTIMNDTVRRTIMPDGRPVPLAYEPGHIDLVLWLPVMYVGYCISSMAIACTMIWLLDLEGTDCKKSLTGWTITLLVLIAITAFTSVWATVMLCRMAMRRDRAGRLERFRIMMYR